MDELAARLDALCAEQPFAVHWLLKDLATGAEIGRGADAVVPSASTRKVSIMMHALSRVNAGALSLSEPCTIEARMQQGVESGTYQYMTPGCVIPLRDALVNMIITSDNVCTQIVLERLDRDALNAWCRGIGMDGTTHRVNFPPPGLPWDHGLDAVASTTARDQALLLERMVRGAADAQEAAALGVTPELCRLGLDIMSWQRLRSLIPSLLPAKTRVANKTGTGPRGRMDVGVVYRGAAPRFILSYFSDQVPVAMPDGLPGQAVSNMLCGRMARAAWDALA